MSLEFRNDSSDLKVTLFTVRRGRILKCDTILLLSLIFTVLALTLIIVLIHGDLGNYNESEKWKVIPILH